MSSLSGLFSFEGRARRSEWWLTSIGTTILGSLVIGIAALLVSGGDWASLANSAANSAAKPAAIVAVNLVIGVLVFWVQTAVDVRRSHDRGQSGVGVITYQLVSYGWSFIPMVILAFGLELPPIPFASAFIFAFAVIIAICGVYFLVTLGFLDGEPTANAYGQSPKTIQNRNDARLAERPKD